VALSGTEVVANETATIDPAGGVIIRTQDATGRDGAQGSVSVRPDVTRDYIAFNLSVYRPKARVKKLEVWRSGKLIHTLNVASTPALEAPTLVRVKSTAPRPVSSNQPVAPEMYPPTAQISVELGPKQPAGVFALVIYKVDPSVRSVAYGMPDAKHVFAYAAGGKQCRGGFEPIRPGERVAVAWLDVHGKVSARSAVVTVAASTP
jgi:hypothetical protein